MKNKTNIKGENKMKNKLYKIIEENGKIKISKIRKHFEFKNIAHQELCNITRELVAEGKIIKSVNLNMGTATLMIKSW
jgi:hypothetical protein